MILNYSKILSILTFASLATISAIFAVPAFAETNPYLACADCNDTSSSNSIITIKTDQPSYNYGDTVTLTGHVTNPQDSTVLTLRAFNPSQNLIKIEQILLVPDGSFSISFHITGPNWSSAGKYTIEARSGLISPVTTTFYFTGVTGTTTISQQTTQASTIPQLTNQPSSTASPTMSTIPSTQPTPPTPIPTPPPSPEKIPNWVKAIFGYYAQGNLSDDDLVKALQFLIQQGIIKVQP